MASIVGGSGPTFGLSQSGLTCCIAQELKRCGRGQTGWLRWCWSAVTMCWQLPGEKGRSAVLSHTHCAREARTVPPALTWAERLPNTLWAPTTRLCLATGSSLRGSGWTQVSPYRCTVVTLLHEGGVPQGRTPVGCLWHDRKNREGGAVAWRGKQVSVYNSWSWQWHQRS